MAIQVNREGKVHAFKPTELSASVEAPTSPPVDPGVLRADEAKSFLISVADGIVPEMRMPRLLSTARMGLKVEIDDLLSDLREKPTDRPLIAAIVRAFALYAATFDDTQQRFASPGVVHPVVGSTPEVKSDRTSVDRLLIDGFREELERTISKAAKGMVEQINSGPKNGTS